MFNSILNYQKKLGIKLGIEFFGSDIIINRADFINIPHPIVCHDMESFKTTVKNLILQSNSDNVIYLHEEDSFKQIPLLAQVINFKKKENNPYAYNGYEMRESDPKELARAVCFINNIRKPVHEQDDEFKSYLLDK